MMTEELTDLTAPKPAVEVKSVAMSPTEEPIFAVLGADPSAAPGKKPNGGAKSPPATAVMATTSDTESGIFSGESETCVEHECELDWFCVTELKLICSHCTIVGSCHGHSVTPLENRVTAVRNHLVDVCEKMQLQAQRMEKFIEHTLKAKEQKLQLSIQEIAERVEEADGVGQPCDTEQLNMKPGCGDSILLRGMWATAMLHGPKAYALSSLKFDERTANHLLSLSDDRCTLTYLHKKPRQPLPYDPARFDCWPNALGSLSLSSGTHSWVVEVGQSAAFKVGICYVGLQRKGSGDLARLGHNDQSWVLSHYDGEYSFLHAGEKVLLRMATRPQRVGILLDWSSHTLLFYEPESATILHCVTHHFAAPLLPAFAVTDQHITILH
ncbi:B box and SPRY domain-containing protein isoform X2 [Syngnathus typhle]|uniref:B box and SPRY domain-containing protein isoform X2 n=1 Tax=Syngnathus typhle TaxID=161592 RepID=UPI002A69B491|nr:B box and SPRY domain-containing protein isoform X2 [Syngnathus typhle]